MNNMLVVAPDDQIRDYLRDAGYNACWSLYSNDLILPMIEKYRIETVIYLTKVNAVIPHEEAIAETRKRQIRVILTADKDKEEPLLNYAAAIGVTDILIYPVNPEEILHRLKNPATVEEVFNFLKQKDNKEAVYEAVVPINTKVPFWRKFFRWKRNPRVDDRPGASPGKGSGAEWKEQVRGGSRENEINTVPSGLPGGQDEVAGQQEADSPDVPVQESPTVLLIGHRAKILAPEAAAKGWKVVTDDPLVPSDAAVIDTDLLSAVSGSLHCPMVGFSSGRLSDWFSLADSGVPVAVDGAACLALVANRLESRTRIQTVSSVKRGFVLAFYSGAQGFQGKTVLAVNTATLLAEKGFSVCIVDLDTDKAGLTVLCGFSEDVPPSMDLNSYISGALPIEGPAGVKLIPAPIRNPGWFPDPQQAGRLVAKLASEYDAVVLDFGAKITSPAVVTALRSCDRVFLVSTPMRAALTAVARFRGRGLAEIGGKKITAVINRTGVRGGISARDAARLLDINGQFIEVPEDQAVMLAENEALEKGTYSPPVLKKKSLIRPALLALLDRAGSCW